MAERKAVITDEEPLKRGHSVPLTDTNADKEIPEFPPDERGGQIQPRDLDDVHGVPEGPGHQDDAVIDGDDPDEDPDADDGPLA
jgi:hypothetical protein